MLEQYSSQEVVIVQLNFEGCCMNIKTTFGIFFTLLGTALLLVSAYVILAEAVVILGLEIESLEAVVTIVLGIIFFSSGIKLIR